MTIPSHLDNFRKNDKKRANLLNRDNGNLRWDEGASDSVISMWQISFEQIYEERRSAANLLSLISFFNPRGIPELVLRSHIVNRTARGKEDNEDLDVLRAYSLVTVAAKSDMCEMH
jgi:hypothetical protein